MVVDRSKSVVNRSHRRAIGTFPNRRAAEQALHELKDSGFPMDRVSVVAQDADRKGSIAGATTSDHHSDTKSDNKADDGAKAGALSGGALGGLTGLLVGLGALAIPGLGPIMLAGAAATALATTAAGTAIGAAAGTLLGGLIGMGIPEDRAKVYNDRVSAGEYLVMVDGTEAEIARAQAILNHRGVEEWGVYDIRQRLVLLRRAWLKIRQYINPYALMQTQLENLRSAGLKRGRMKQAKWRNLLCPLQSHLPQRHIKRLSNPLVRLV
jgi:hypothetical protein